MDRSTLIALGGVIISAVSLAIAFYTAWRARRDRKIDQCQQDLRFRQMNEPVLMLKPQFSLAPTQNRLLLDITNLHSSIAVQDFVAKIHSTVEFDNKVERQDISIELTSLKAGASTSVEAPGFLCDFDSFISNLGRNRFERQLAQVDVAQAVETLRHQGYLKHGQPSIGTISVSWQYRAAQPTADLIAREAIYRLFVWQYEHGVFLTFEWPSISGR